MSCTFSSIDIPKSYKEMWKSKKEIQIKVLELNFLLN